MSTRFILGVMPPEDETTEPSPHAYPGGPSMFLKIPVRDLPAAVGCLVLGTLYGLKEDALTVSTGTALALQVSRPLGGKIPAALMRVMNGMDEIDWHGSFPKDERRARYIDELIGRTLAVLRELPDTDYNMCWVIEVDPLASNHSLAAAELNPFYEPLPEAEVLAWVGRYSRSHARHAHLRRDRGGMYPDWATWIPLTFTLSTSDPEEIRRHLQALTEKGYVEAAPDHAHWRPTDVGWERIEEIEREKRTEGSD